MSIISPFIVSALLMCLTYLSIVNKILSTMLKDTWFKVDIFNHNFCFDFTIFSPSTFCRWACRRRCQHGSPLSRSGWTGHCTGCLPGWSELARWADLELFWILLRCYCSSYKDHHGSSDVRCDTQVQTHLHQYTHVHCDCLSFPNMVFKLQGSFILTNKVITSLACQARI